MKRKSFRVGVVLILCATLFAGCSKGSNTSNKKTNATVVETDESETSTEKVIDDKSIEPVEITFSHWGGDATYEGIYKQRIEEFEKENPNITVDVLTVADDYETKLQTMIAGNQAPDVIQVAENGMGFATKGVFLDLTDKIAEAGINTQDLWGNTVDQYTYNNELFGIPDRGGCTVMYYNKDLFDDANISYPTDEWTLDDYFSAIEKLTKDTDGDGKIDQWGTTSTHYQAIWGYMLQSNGGNVMKDGEVVINSPENLELLTRYNEAYKNGWVVSYEELEQSNSGGDNYFLQGKIGINLTGLWNVSSYTQDANLNFDIAAVPQGATPAGWPMGSALAISKTSSTEKQEAAWKFIQYMTSEEAQTILGQSMADCPANLKVLQSADFSSQLINGKVVNLGCIATGVSRISVDGVLRGAYYQEIINEARNQIKEMLLGRLTPEECLKTMESNMKDILLNYE